MRPCLLLKILVIQLILSNMWICKKCNEENEDSFDACWKCQTESDIGLKKSKIYHKELKEEKKKEAEDKEKESLIYEQLDKKAIQIWGIAIFAGLSCGIGILALLISIGYNLPKIVVAAIIYYSGSQAKKAYTKHLKKKIVEQLKQ